MIGWAFREAVYSHVGLPSPSSQKPSAKVLFYVRNNGHREFSNLQDMLAIADKYGVEYT